VVKDDVTAGVSTLVAIVMERAVLVGIAAAIVIVVSAGNVVRLATVAVESVARLAIVAAAIVSAVSLVIAVAANAVVADIEIKDGVASGAANAAPIAAAKEALSAVATAHAAASDATSRMPAAANREIVTKVRVAAIAVIPTGPIVMGVAMASAATAIAHSLAELTATSAVTRAAYRMTSVIV
jgi:hypothetical protein